MNIKLLLIVSSYTVVREMTSGKGFADVVFIPVKPDDRKSPAMIIELKRNDCVESAIKQIREKKYYTTLGSDPNVMIKEPHTITMATDFFLSTHIVCSGKLPF